jgi:hypothetical protein
MLMFRKADVASAQTQQLAGAQSQFLLQNNASAKLWMAHGREVAADQVCWAAA